MPVFMILVVNAHARVISWVGMRGDRLATVVIRRGRHNEWYQSGQADYSLP